MANLNLSKELFGPWSGGMVENREPHLLKPNELSNAVNVVFDKFAGRIDKRPGTVSPKTVPYLTRSPRSACVFTKADGKSYLLVTDDTEVVATEDLIAWMRLTSLWQFDTDSRLQFETAEDRVWIFNGSDAVHSWDGTAPAETPVMPHDPMVEHGTDSPAAGYSCEDGVDFTSISTNALVVETSGAGDAGVWLKKKICITDASGLPAVGEEATLVSWAAATHTYVISPAFSGDPGASHKCKVGVKIPAGRFARYHYGTMFMGNMSAEGDVSGVRFAERTDPNAPAYDISLDNPNAWPAINQFEVGPDEGDRIWGFTPVFHDRFAAMKATGIYRIDPDATVGFAPTVVSRAVGSRYQRSWVQQGEKLVFLGHKVDGLPDIFMTDLNSIGSIQRRHSKTLDNILQPYSYIQHGSIATQTEFDVGTSGGTLDTDNARAEVGVYDTEAEFEDYVAALTTNADVVSTPGKVAIKGLPHWECQYDPGVRTGGSGDPNDLPTAASPVWAESSSGNPPSMSIVDGALRGTFAYGSGTLIYGSGGCERNYYRETVLNASQNSLMVVRARRSAGFGRIIFGVYNGAKCIYYWTDAVYGNSPYTTLYRYGYNGVAVANLYNNTWYTMHLELDKNGKFKLWVDGASVDSGDAAASSSNQVRFAFDSYGIPANTVDYDFVNYHSDFAYTCADMPDTLPSSGEIVWQFDFKRTPWTTITQWFGKWFRKLADYHAGTIVLSSSASTDGITWDDYITFNNGATPTSTKKQYLRIKAVLTRDSYGYGPIITKLTGGALYMTEPLLIGQNVTLFRNFEQDASSTPTAKTMYVRRSKNVSTNPPNAITDTGWDTVLTGGDANGWVAIGDGDSLHTKLDGDDDAEASVWLQFLWMDEPTSADSVPWVDNLFWEWLEGSVADLPIQAVLHQDRYLLICANKTSPINDIVVSFDSNGAISNWLDWNINLFVWFKGYLYTGKCNAAGTMRDLVLVDVGILSDEGAAIDAYIETHQAVMRDIMGRKVPRYLDVAVKPMDTTLAVLYRSAVEAAYTALNTVAFDSQRAHKRLNFPMGKQVERIMLKVRNNVAGQNFGLELMSLGYNYVPSGSGE